jgi:hypothetical protein
MIYIFDKSLRSSQYVVSNAEHVKINMPQLNEFVDKLSIENSIHWLHDLPFGMDKLSTEELVNFLLIYHTMGFCYWGQPKWEVEYKGNKYDGAYGYICALTKEIEKNKLFLDFTYLSSLSYEEFEVILSGNIEIPLIKERYDCLMEVSKIVSQKMNNNFCKFTKDMNNDIELTNFLIDNFPSFVDVSEYKKREIYYYKRAQLLVSDILHIKQEQLGSNVDYSNLIGCADYKIPQVLRDLKIVEYDDKLSELVDNKVEIEKGSIYEIEIRSTMLVIVDYIKNKSKNRYNGIDINDYIWLQGQNKNNINRPYHRTRTIAY